MIRNNNLKSTARKWSKINIIVISIISILISGIAILCMDKNIYAASGSGTSDSPYIVSTFNELKNILNTTRGTTSHPYYVGLSANIYITEHIEIPSGGHFILYAYGRSRTLYRSSSYSGKSTGYCIGISSGASLQLGGVNSYTLYLNGNKSNVTYSRGYFDNYGSLIICGYARIINSQNNVSGAGGAIHNSGGTVKMTGGYIYNCISGNGGAIYSESSNSNSGKVIIEGGKIGTKSYPNIAESEGGGIYIMGKKSNYKSTLTMTGGSVQYNQSKEEGGGIFACGKYAYVNLTNGTISHNSSGLSGGGVCATYGTNLVIGDDGKGPLITYNSGSVGGGIRCNGGNDASTQGGVTYMYGGTISYNYADRAGGVSVGSGDYTQSIFVISDMIIKNNTSVNT
ncbi:MAG: hypothetical protein ACI4DS_02470, partial [Eubacterium sp.]